jgi:UDP-N-acetylmuramyl pentapeptide synthase
MADQAEQVGFDKKKIFKFSRAEQAALPLQKKIKKGDLILIKGSRAMKMEKIVKEVMAHPEKADKLLVG